jgi:hypothetical protein
VTGFLSFRVNSALTTLNLPSLSIVTESLAIFDNPLLTYASLPKTTFIGSFMTICANSAFFTIPSSPNAPAGGLVVSGVYKNQVMCNLQQGDMACSLVSCP